MPTPLTIELVILLSIIIVVLVALMLWLAGLKRTAVPFIPVRTHVFPSLERALKLHPNAVLYDLGSGDGRVLEYIAKRNPEINAIGIERAFLPALLAKCRRIFNSNRKQLLLKRKDFFEEDLSRATHVFLFLFPKVMAKLDHKLSRELAPGTRVVSCDFAFPDRVPDEEIVLEGTHAHGKRLLVYIF